MHVLTNWFKYNPKKHVTDTKGACDYTHQSLGDIPDLQARTSLVTSSYTKKLIDFWADWASLSGARGQISGFLPLLGVWQPINLLTKLISQ